MKICLTTSVIKHILMKLKMVFKIHLNIANNAICTYVLNTITLENAYNRNRHKLGLINCFFYFMLPVWC